MTLIQYTVLYCLVDVSLLGFSIGIYFYVTQDFGSEEETFRFKLLVVTLILYLMSDLVLGAVYGEYLNLSFYANMFVVYCNIISMALVSFLWYRYALLRISSRLDENKIQEVVSSVPIIYIIIMVSGSVFNGWAFKLVEGGGYEAGEWYASIMAAGALYLIVISIMAAARYLRARSRAERSSYLWLALFVLPPVVSVVVELLVPRTPVMAMGVYAAIHLTFFSYQSRRIYDDALTGLNNRRRIDEFLEARIGNTQMVFYLFDVNSFKEVNDRYGHSEGDRALCEVANAIRGACAGKQAIVGRYGGDEFAVVTVVRSEDRMEDPWILMDDVRKSLEVRTQELNLP